MRLPSSDAVVLAARAGLRRRRWRAGQARSTAARATDYTDTITAQGGRGARLQDDRRRAGDGDPDDQAAAAGRRAPSPAAAASGAAKVDPAAQRARDSDARRILEDELQARGRAPGRAAEGIQQRRARAAGQRANYQKYLDRVAELQAAITRKEDDIAAHQARAAASCRRHRRCRCDRRRPARRPGARADDAAATRRSTCWRRWSRVVTPDGDCVSPTPRSRTRSACRGAAWRAARSSTGSSTPQLLRDTVAAVARNDFATSRLDAQLQAAGREPRRDRCRCT